MALAVLLDAVGFLAGAAFDGHESLDVLEVTGVPVVRHHFGGFDIALVAGLVVAANARALATTHLPLIEAIAVEL